MSSVRAFQPLVLPIDQLQPNPLQPRGKIKKEDLGDLAGSIEQFGILEPIVVAHTPAGYQIIAGERRWRAAKLAGLEEVPVSVVETSQRGMLEMAITENLQREDLSALERAQAFHQLEQDFRISAEEISKRMGKSVPFVINSLRLLQLPDAIKDGLAGGLITEGHARALLGAGDHRLMIECYKQVLKENATVRRAEEIARRAKESMGKPTAASKKQFINSPQLEDWQQQLQQRFQKAKIKINQSDRYTEVVFKIKATPAKAEAELQKIMRLTEVLEKVE